MAFDTILAFASNPFFSFKKPHSSVSGGSRKETQVHLQQCTALSLDGEFFLGFLELGKKRLRFAVLKPLHDGHGLLRVLELGNDALGGLVILQLGDEGGNFRFHCWSSADQRGAVP